MKTDCQSGDRRRSNYPAQLNTILFEILNEIGSGDLTAMILVKSSAAEETRRLFIAAGVDNFSEFFVRSPKSCLYSR